MKKIHKNRIDAFTKGLGMPSEARDFAELSVLCMGKENLIDTLRIELQKAKLIPNASTVNIAYRHSIDPPEFELTEADKCLLDDIVAYSLSHNFRWTETVIRMKNRLSQLQYAEVKHPINSMNQENEKVWYCYSCGAVVQHQAFCHGCGRKLNWRTSNENGKK